MDQGRILSDLRERVGASAFHRWVGIEVEEAEEGTVTVSLQATDHHRNLIGTMHGGLVATLGDTAAGLAVRTMLEPTRRGATIQLGVHYLAPGGAGVVRARGRVVRMGRSVAYAEADVVDEDEVLLARVTATFALSED